MHHAFTRTLGVATAAYGAATMVKPGVLAPPTQLDTTPGETSRPLQTLIRAIGVRDVASGIAIAMSPPGRTLRWRCCYGSPQTSATRPSSASRCQPQRRVGNPSVERPRGQP